MISLDDGLLVAYVDGELDAATAREIEAALRKDPEARKRAAILREAGRVLKRLAKAEGRRGHLTPQRKSPLWMLMGSACAAALAIGVGLGANLTPHLAPPTEVAVASDQVLDDMATGFRVFASDTRRPVELGAAQVEELTTWLSSRLRHPVHVTDLTPAGLSFLGGRLVVIDEHPSALLIYTRADGLRVGVGITGAWTAPNEECVVENRVGMAIGYWAHNGFTHMVMGEAPAEFIQAIAERFEAEQKLDPATATSRL